MPKENNRVKQRVQLNKENRKTLTNWWIRADSEWYIENDFGKYTKISNLHLHMVGKLRRGITTLNIRLTHGTEAENKGGKTRC